MWLNWERAFKTIINNKFGVRGVGVQGQGCKGVGFRRLQGGAVVTANSGHVTIGNRSLLSWF